MLFIFMLSVNFNSQIINLTKYGSAKNSETFKKALTDIKNTYSSKKQHVVLFIPSGNYTITEPITLNKYISLEGDFANSTILNVNSTTQEAIILEDNKNEADIYNAYNTIKNLTITGPDFNKNPFEWKDLKRNNPKSVGIKILGLRNRIDNVTIDGFLWSGIEISSSYYNYITNSFIKNNRIGITIDKTSTSAYINNNELRTNSLGILIQNNSYANFINNNMIESNISHMLEPAKSGDDINPYILGTGIMINNAMNNFIQNNYFEQHFNNVSLNNSYGNEISSNFFAVNQLNKEDQAILKLTGKSENNVFSQNQTMGANPNLDVTKTVLSKMIDYSTNTIDFGKAKNIQLKGKLKNSNQKLLPQIP